MRIARGLKTCLLLLAAGAALASMAGCARGSAGADTGGLEITVMLVGERPAVGPAVVEVTVADSAGRPVEAAEVSVRGDMNHAGMKPVISQAMGTEPGRYVTGDFKFTMPGDWIITAEVTPKGGTKVEKTINLSGVAGG